MHRVVCLGIATMYKDAGAYVFGGVFVGAGISLALGYVGFGIEALMPVVLCAVAAYYFGKSQTKDS